MQSRVIIQSISYDICFAFLNSLAPSQMSFFLHLHYIWCCRNTKLWLVLRVNRSLCALWTHSALSSGRGFQLFGKKLFLLNTPMTHHLKGISLLPCPLLTGLISFCYALYRSLLYNLKYITEIYLHIFPNTIHGWEVWLTRT